MGNAAEVLTPRIYVACLAAYNSGYLHGAWIKVGEDAEALRAAIEAMLVASPVAGAEEYAIHDFDGFGGFEVGEYVGLDRLIEVAEFLRNHGVLGALVLEHYSGDLDEADAAMEERYRGVHDSLASYLQDLTEETVEITQALAVYIDCEAMAPTGR